MCWLRHIYAAGYIDRKLTHRRKHAKTSDVVQPRMDKSSRDSFHGFCTLCRCDFDISSQGKAAIERHAGTEKHKSNRRAAGISLLHFIPREGTLPLDNKISAAELCKVYYAVK